MTIHGYITTKQMHARRPDIPLRTLQWHCSDPSGQLYEVAVKSGSWHVPLADAEKFITEYKRPAGGRQPQRHAGGDSGGPPPAHDPGIEG